MMMDDGNHFIAHPSSLLLLLPALLDPRPFVSERHGAVEDRAAFRGIRVHAEVAETLEPTSAASGCRLLVGIFLVLADVLRFHDPKSSRNFGAMEAFSQYANRRKQVLG